MLLNLNAESKFSLVPQVNNPRSMFDLSHSYKTSFNVGDLICNFCEEVLPGDTHSIDTNVLARMQPLVAPIMSDIYLDQYFFFVPNRLVWSHWKNFMGENTNSSWYPNTEYNVPHYIFDDSTDIPSGSIADYFGIPITLDGFNKPNISVNKLPFRALALIYNEWFRDENLVDPILVDIDEDSDSAPDDLIIGKPYKVAKYHDVYTSCLPEPQKGPDVMLPLSGIAPVVTKINQHYINNNPVNFVSYEGGDAPDLAYAYFSSSGKLRSGGSVPSSITTASTGIVPNNLWADLSLAQASSINSLRLALATQSFYETNARSGSRYREMLKAHFGVTSPDARMQVPELLSYNRTDININQVVQNSASTDDSPLGRQAAYSLTADADNSFSKSFTEHGFILGVCCARYKHSYQQGLNRRFSRRTMFDYYFPVFAHLGEQPLLNKEIYAYNSSDVNNEVFGYQEAFSEYRFHPDIVTGEMRSGIPNSLDVWHLADFYNELPKLSPEWIAEDSSIIDRCLAVTSAVSNQLFADFYFENKCVRVMPVYSIPGLPRTL